MGADLNEANHLKEDIYFRTGASNVSGGGMRLYYTYILRGVGHWLFLTMAQFRWLFINNKDLLLVATKF